MVFHLHKQCLSDRSRTTLASKIILIDTDGGSWWYDASVTPGRLLQQNLKCANNILPKGIVCDALFRDGQMYWNMPQLKYCCTCYTNLSITGAFLARNPTPPPILLVLYFRLSGCPAGVDWIVNSTYDGMPIQACAHANSSGVTIYNITNTQSYLWSRPIFDSPYYETVASATPLNLRCMSLPQACRFMNLMKFASARSRQRRRNRSRLEGLEGWPAR